MSSSANRIDEVHSAPYFYGRQMVTESRDKQLKSLRPEERLIVALDVPTSQEAVELVNELEGIVSFFKVGLELLMAGGLEDLLRRLVKEKQVFVDLKLPDDIPATAMSVVRSASRIGVRFLTLSHSAGPATIDAAVRGRLEGGGRPGKTDLLFVPALSSLDQSDFASMTGRPASEFQSDLVDRARRAQGLGADGFIISGQEIAILHEAFPTAILVSPGIRPSWAPQDDHKRACTPSQAVALGADYIVVGRPIRNAAGKDARRDAAKRIIDDIAAGLGSSTSRASGRAESSAPQHA